MTDAATDPRLSPQVLVVDDDPGMRMALETSFLRHGWRVETAAGAGKAAARNQDITAMVGGWHCRTLTSRSEGFGRQ